MWGPHCRNMISAIIKGGSARDLKVDGCGDKGFRQVQALSMRGNTLLLFGDLNPPDVLDLTIILTHAPRGGSLPTLYRLGGRVTR